MDEFPARGVVGTPEVSGLAALAADMGSLVTAGANRPIRLDDPDSVWLIESGALDVFFVELEDGAATSGLSHLLRAGTGRVVFEVDSDSFGLVAKGLPDSLIWRLKMSDLQRQASHDDFADQVDAWIMDFAATVASGIEPRPMADMRMKAGDRQDGQLGHTVFAHPGDLVWIEPTEHAIYLGTEALDSDDTDLVPLTSETWVLLSEDASLRCASSRSLESHVLLNGLRCFHRLALSAEQLNRALNVADRANAQVARVTHHRVHRDRSREMLFSVLDSAERPSEGQVSDVMAALDAVGRHENIDFRWPQSSTGNSYDDQPIQESLRESRVNFRRVRLNAQMRWWRGDSGAMLAFRRAENAPVALLPSRFGSYREFNPKEGEYRRLNAQSSQDLESDAWCFYQSFPEEKRLTAGRLGRFGFSKTGAICVLLTVAGLLATLQVVMPAFLAGDLAGRLVPPVTEGTMLFFGIVLVGMAVFSMLMLTAQGVLMTRVEGRVTGRTSAALIDRLLKLPLKFGRQFSTGGLTTRIMSLWVLRDQFAGILVQSILAVVFLLPVLALLFLYDAALAATSIVIAVAALCVIVALGLPQVEPQRARFMAMRSVAGRTDQYFRGIRKLRSAGAEDSAFGSVIRGVQDQLLARRRADDLNRHLIAASAAVPALGSTVLFAVAASRGFDQDRASDFLVVYIVSLVLFSAVANLGRIFEGITTSVPTYEQIRPILRAKPDDAEEAAWESTRGLELGGGLRFDNVSFRYHESGPLILGGVNIEVASGEFVAVVGSSGAGKSTLIRLALGLEEPLSGAVYYDERDLATMSAHSIRRQIGLVSQDFALHPGNILQNILGFSNDLTIDDAWSAARLADIAEEIEAMPMQMFTPVGDNTSTFSGGQQQRMQIAAALVRRPRIVLLDEATSWLDVNSQARVMRGIGSLSVTRIVIAHRLSTVQAADRIFVLADGRVSQQGTFEELRDADGLFRQLMERQVT